MEEHRMLSKRSDRSGMSVLREFCQMRKSSWTPSNIPNEEDALVYLVADDFGRAGRAWRDRLRGRRSRNGHRRLNLVKSLLAPGILGLQRCELGLNEPRHG